MSKLLSILLAVVLFSLAIVPSATAADLANGEKVFHAVCAACHLGGKNVVKASKGLKKSDLEKYDMYSAEAVRLQVNYGKAAMPAFRGRLTDRQIEDVAAYVIDRADKW